MNNNFVRIKVLNYDIELTSNTIKIYNGNKIKNSKMMLAILLKIRNQSPFIYRRTNKGFILEWIFLNKLSKFLKFRKAISVTLKDTPNKFINYFLKNREENL